jgi:hypothetical protein
MPKVFVFPNGVQKRTGNLYFDVISEDGVFMSQEVFHSKEDAYGRLGVGTSTERHDLYRRYYPAGFEIEAVEDPPTHAGFQAAMAAHKAMSIEEYARRSQRLDVRGETPHYRRKPLASGEEEEHPGA